jgi:DNA mismatch endonuclease (patch repair protein)
MPVTNAAYWHEKISRNCERDKKNINELKLLGWRVLIVWECALNKKEIANSINKTIDWLNNLSSNFYEVEK